MCIEDVLNYGIARCLRFIHNGHTTEIAERRLWFFFERLLFEQEDIREATQEILNDCT